MKRENEIKSTVNDLDNKGYHPNITIHPKHNIASSQAHNFAIDLNELQSTLKAEIFIA